MKLRKNKAHKDGAFSGTVTMIVIIPILFALIITTIDISLFFQNRMTAQSAAQAGARQAAVLGDTREAGRMRRDNPIFKEYGRGVSATDAVWQGLTDPKVTDYDDRDPKYYGTILKLVDKKSIQVQCGNSYGAMGIKIEATEEVRCTVSYKYYGLNTIFSFVPKSTQTVYGTARSEVTIK